jgi:DtxR family transcriptional regulator, Mn-dependent transcriptional regulator
MQISPIYLLIILLVGVLALALLYPKRGILARYRAWRGRATRRQIEDALKYFFNQEQEGGHVTIDSLAGALGMHTRAAVDLLIKMQDQGLLIQDERYVTLTSEGRRLAVQVTRAHRLLERYLADEARMPLEQVHNEANQREHGLSSTEVDALDADLGYPTHDPHGDPIPDPGGRPRSTATPAVSLPGLQVGQRGRISHLEDEPQIAFAQLVAQGFFLGQSITVLEKTPAKIVLTDGDQEFSIAPAIAANIFLQPFDEGPARPEQAIPLDWLPNKAVAEIFELDERCQGYTRRRFLDLGLTPGTRIFPELNNPFREPRAYRVRGTLIALRNDQASMIWVLPQAEH